MKKTILLLIYITLCSHVNAQTQQEINMTAQKEYKNAENEINKTYKEILQKYKSDTLFIKNLKTSQRIWIQFRDAEVKMKYPSNDPFTDYGSIYPVCYYGYMEILTKERIKKLSEWLSDSNEADICNGGTKPILNFQKVNSF